MSEEKSKTKIIENEKCWVCFSLYLIQKPQVVLLHVSQTYQENEKPSIIFASCHSSQTYSFK
jgi:hypothetical protein